MPEQMARAFVALAVEKIDDDGLQWIEVLPTAAKVRNGPWYFTIEREDLEAYAAYIHENADSIMVDYDHKGAREDRDTRAAGWFTGEAEVRDVDDGSRLYARVRWTSEGAVAVKERIYRFISAEFNFEQRDAKSGLMTKAKAIIAATLTNRPFFSELAPVADEKPGDVVWSPSEGFEALRQKIYAALNPAGVEEARYWVSDVAPGKALVQEYGAGKAWVVAFSVEADEVRIAAQADWIEAEQEWVAAATENARAGRSTRAFDAVGDEAAALFGLPAAFVSPLYASS